MDKSKKRELLYKLIHDGQWQQVLVFTRSKHGANKLCDDFLRSIERLTSQKIKKVVVKGYEVDPSIQAEPVNLGGRGNRGGGQKRNSRPKQKKSSDNEWNEEKKKPNSRNRNRNRSRNRNKSKENA